MKKSQYLSQYDLQQNWMGEVTVTVKGPYLRIWFLFDIPLSVTNCIFKNRWINIGVYTGNLSKCPFEKLSASKILWNFIDLSCKIM